MDPIMAAPTHRKEKRLSVQIKASTRFVVDVCGYLRAGRACWVGLRQQDGASGAALVLLKEGLSLHRIDPQGRGVLLGGLTQGLAAL